MLYPGVLISDGERREVAGATEVGSTGVCQREEKKRNGAGGAGLGVREGESNSAKKSSTNADIRNRMPTIVKKGFYISLEAELIGGNSV